MGDNDKSGPGRRGDRRAEAGEQAEEQIRFYLNRAFGSSKDLRIINNLRLRDEQNTKEGGEPDVCQIDHLVIHRWGMFIVESKSIHGTVKVRPDGSGGDEWVRTFGRGPSVGMNSPIAQGERQATTLRRVLQAARETLRGKITGAAGLVSKLVNKTDQRGFMSMPIQVIAAISETGKVERAKDWSPGGKPCQHFLCKADQVTAKIQSEFERHRKASRLSARPDGDYGVWSMEAEELDAVESFLRASDCPLHGKTSRAPVVPATPPPPAAPARTSAGRKTSSPSPTAPAEEAPPAAPTCKSCQSTRLSAMWGKYGYYWKCADCNLNTAMPTVCSCCGEAGAVGKGVRIRKEGPRYYRKCEQCGIEERIWTEPAASASG